MKIISLELAKKLKESADKVGYVLPESENLWGKKWTSYQGIDKYEGVISLEKYRKHMDEIPHSVFVENFGEGIGRISAWDAQEKLINKLSYKAYTTDELLGILPHGWLSNGFGTLNLSIIKQFDSGDWLVGYFKGTHKGGVDCTRMLDIEKFEGKNLVELLGNLYEYLISNKLIK
mgnify:CR=1 FL=1